MKARNWLIAKGLAKPGRGRLSLSARAELDKAISEGVVFDDYKSDNTAKPRMQKSVVTAAEIVHNRLTRAETVCYGIDKAATTAQSDLVIAFESCSGCGKPVVRCTHEIPLLPKWIGGGQALLTKP